MVGVVRFVEVSDEEDFEFWRSTIEDCRLYILEKMTTSSSKMALVVPMTLKAILGTLLKHRDVMTLARFYNGESGVSRSVVVSCREV